MAILKLTEEAQLSEPSQYVRAAKKDYRDVLAWAEYPNQKLSKSWKEKDPKKINKLRQLDEKQYQYWLKKP